VKELPHEGTTTTAGGSGDQRQDGKTVVVTVERRYRHALYGKVVRSAKKYMAHDEENACHAGDRVQIVETRPYSRRKRWAVEQILERAA